MSTPAEAAATPPPVAVGLDESKMIPPPHVATALALTVQDWNHLGIDPEGRYADLSDADLQGLMVERATALLLIRIVAILRPRDFADLSSSTICRTILVTEEKPWCAVAPEITHTMIQQLRHFVQSIFDGYRDTPYHCCEHGTRAFTLFCV
jgi:hypothetical protein